MGRVDGSGGFRAQFPVMLLLPSEVTKPTSYKDNSLSLSARAELQQEKGKKINDNSVLLARDVNLRTESPLGGAFRAGGVACGTISICTMEGPPIKPKRRRFHLKHTGNTRGRATGRMSEEQRFCGIFLAVCLCEDSSVPLKMPFYFFLPRSLSVVFLCCAAGVRRDGGELDVATPRSLRGNDSLQRMLTAADCLRCCILSQVMYQQSEGGDSALRI